MDDHSHSSVAAVDTEAEGGLRQTMGPVKRIHFIVRHPSESLVIAKSEWKTGYRDLGNAFETLNTNDSHQKIQPPKQRVKRIRLLVRRVSQSLSMASTNWKLWYTRLGKAFHALTLEDREESSTDESVDPVHSSDGDAPYL